MMIMPMPIFLHTDTCSYGDTLPLWLKISLTSILGLLMFLLLVMLIYIIYEIFKDYA
jgi:hypothetical protein